MRALLAWLNKRFPEQLTVTRQDYTELRQEVAQYNVMYQHQKQIIDALASIEKRLSAVENANGFVNTSKGGFKLER